MATWWGRGCQHPLQPEFPCDHPPHYTAGELGSWEVVRWITRRSKEAPSPLCYRMCHAIPLFNCQHSTWGPKQANSLCYKSIPTIATKTVAIQLSAIVDPCAIQVPSDPMEDKLIRIKSANHLRQYWTTSFLKGINRGWTSLLVWPKCLTPCCKFENFVKGIEYCEIIASTQSF